jgi:hypothetical protein
VSTGIDPTALAELDVDMFGAMVHAAGDRWTHTDELLRVACTLLDTLVRVTVSAHADPKKGPPQFGPPFRYLRPGEIATSTVPVVSPREIALRMGLGR